jgi:hypothetical protein
MPTGARTITQGGKRVLVGQLTYYTTNPPLCSVCEDMMWAIEERLWFVEAHEEYLRQIKFKKHLLGQK